MAKDNYCDIQEHCKPLLAANRQYKKVVEQNRSLQGELNNAKEELEYLASFFNKDETAIVNRLLRYNRAIKAIKEIAEAGLKPVCYKSYCQSCKCYSKENKEELSDILNKYFSEDGEFNDDNADFYEVLEGYIDRERVACNKAKPMSEDILKEIERIGE